MYSCNNCKSQFPTLVKKCPGCAIRLNADRVTLTASESAPADDYSDLDVSHRCGNCGDILFNEAGRCSSCRFPISGAQLRLVHRQATGNSLSHTAPRRAAS